MKAFAIRNNLNKMLFDVVVINKVQPELSEMILSAVQFDIASAYVEDYNQSIQIN